MGSTVVNEHDGLYSKNVKPSTISSIFSISAFEFTDFFKNKFEISASSKAFMRVFISHLIIPLKISETYNQIRTNLYWKYAQKAQVLSVLHVVPGLGEQHAF